MWLTHETLSILISTHVIKVFGAETVEWVSLYFIIWPGPRGCALSSLLSYYCLYLRCQWECSQFWLCHYLWPGVTGKRGNRMWQFTFSSRVPSRAGARGRASPGDTLVPSFCGRGSSCLKFSLAASVQPSAHPAPSWTGCALGRTSTAHGPKYV